MSENPFDFSEYRTRSSGPAGHANATPSPDPLGVMAPDAASFATSGHGGAAESEPGLVVARPPLRLLAGAAALAAVGLLVALLAGDRPGLAVAGWVLAGPAGFTALSLYTSVDTRQRARSIYAGPAWAGTAYWLVVGLLLTALVASAFRIAEWVGRL